MGAYVPLFSLHVAHLFFQDGKGRDLEFVPTPQTVSVINRIGLMVRSSSHGLSLFFDEEQAEVLSLYADDSETPFQFEYLLYSKDPLFRNYTAGPSYRDKALLYFGSRKAKKEADGRFRMHTNKSVSASSFKAFDAPELKRVLSKKDLLVKPVAVIRIDCSQAPTEAKTYIIRFGARTSYWKYLIMGERTKDPLYISDLASKIQFESEGLTTLSDQHTAQSFLSEAPMPLMEVSDRRFQLKAGQPGRGKTLIRRLPVASSAQITKALIKGKESVVSEIFVNC